MMRPKPALDYATTPRGGGATRLYLLLALGAALWLLLPAGPSGRHASLAVWRWIVALGCAGIACIPAVQKVASRFGSSLRNPSVKTRALLGVCVALAASLYFVLTAINQDRDFFPKTHDECSYLIQMRMLATGHLWMPRHELADFFDSFYLIVRPVYASMYFPGTAMMFVPALCVSAPTWLMPVLVAGAIVGLVYRLIAEFVDGAAGLLAAMLLVSLSWYRMLSIMLMSQLPVLLLGLVMIWAWSRWRGGAMGRPWLVLIGACAGWAAITRPLDALCFAVPVGCAVASDWVYLPKIPNLHRRGGIVVSLLLVIAGAGPFLTIQLIQNRGVTGHTLQTPFGLYAARDFPGTSYGFHAPAPQSGPQSVIPQKQLFYDRWAKPFIVDHQLSHLATDQWRRRIPIIADTTLPARPLLILLPVGLLGLADRRCWVLFAALPLFVAGYVGYTFFLEHYALVVAPAVALLVVMAIGTIGDRWPRVAVPLAAFVMGLALTNLWEINRSISDEPFRATWLRELHQSRESGTIVLFTFDLDPSDPDLVSKIAQEPVYNVDVSWPDDAPLIRAHDLGARNVELFRYYAARQPGRMVYRFSRRTGQVETLGRVGDLGRAVQK